MLNTKCFKLVAVNKNRIYSELGRGNLSILLGINSVCDVTKNTSVMNEQQPYVYIHSGLANTYIGEFQIL